MITGRGVTLLLAMALALLTGRFIGIGELYAVGVACAVAVLLGLAYVWRSSSRVSARRIVEVDRVIAGGTVEVQVELRNDGRVPTPTLLVAETLPDTMPAVGHPEAGVARFVAGAVPPSRVLATTYRAVATVRGRHAVGPISVRVRDPFGVAERIRRYTATTDVVVYPHIEALPPQRVVGAHMGSGSSDSRRVFATGDEFFGMREYVRGDDLRMVHWPSTAHRQTLMVRQMEQPWQPHATLLLDTRSGVHTAGREGTLETGVSTAASVLYHLADHAYAVRLLTDADTGRGGPQPWEESMDRLAVLEPTDHTGLVPAVAAARGGEGLFVAVLGVPAGRGDLAHDPDLRALFGVRGFGQRLAVVVADPDRRERADRMVGLLVASGWRAAVRHPGEPLAPLWADLGSSQPRHGVAAGADVEAAR